MWFLHTERVFGRHYGVVAVRETVSVVMLLKWWSLKLMGIPRPSRPLQEGTAVLESLASLPHCALL